MESVETQDVNVWTPAYNVEYYGSEFGYDTSDALAYGWGRNITTLNWLTWETRTWGGSSAGWFGSATFSKMKLHQSSTINTFGLVSITWPPAWSGSSTSKSWSSELVTSNPTGSSHPTIRANGINGSVVVNAILEDSGEIYVVGSGYIYRPGTYINFYI